MANSVKLKFAYTGTDFTRVYNLDDVADEALDDVKSKVIALNQKVAAYIDGTNPSDGDARVMRSVFVADSLGGNSGIGYFEKISEATVVVEEVTKIPLF